MCHPRLVSVYPYIISHMDVQLRFLESRFHDEDAGLPFFPKDRKQKQLVDQVRQVLITAGSVVE